MNWMTEKNSKFLIFFYHNVIVGMITLPYKSLNKLHSSDLLKILRNLCLLQYINEIMVHHPKCLTNRTTCQKPSNLPYSNRISNKQKIIFQNLWFESMKYLLTNQAQFAKQWWYFKHTIRSSTLISSIRIEVINVCKATIMVL